MVKGNTTEVLFCKVHVNESGRHTLPFFSRNMFFCLLLSLLIGKVWVARMHW